MQQQPQANGNGVPASPRKKQRTSAVTGDGGPISKVTVVLGAQWGDEGKGKVVDMLAMDADVVCRCQVPFPSRCPSRTVISVPAALFVHVAGATGPGEFSLSRNANDDDRMRPSDLRRRMTFLGRRRSIAKRNRPESQESERLGK